MDTNLPFFNLPFVDSDTSELVLSGRSKPEGSYEDIQSTLSTHSLLGTDDVLAQFLSSDEPLEEPDLNGPATLHCEICKKKFDNAKKYYGHLRVHSKENLWICDKCPDQKFSTKQLLMKHSLTHKPLERMWRCSQCSMTFEALWRMQQHLFAKHLNYRPHKCTKCEKAFQKPSDLKNHMDIHNNVKKFACPLCERLFQDKSNLKRHYLHHNKDKPYMCSGCKTKFAQSASMKRHIAKCALYKAPADADPHTRKHHCRSCGAMFQYKSALLEHVVRQHTNTTSIENKKEKSNSESQSSDATATDDNNIVDDILSAEDDYGMSSQTNQTNIYDSQPGYSQNIDNDSLMQIEFLKNINELHTLDDELLYNDLDFNIHNTFNDNTNFIDYPPTNNTEKTSELFDYPDPTRTAEQDIINELYQTKFGYLPDELLNVPEIKTNDILPNPAVSVSECATIFESDVDLEASANLAANLNQLIGENSVQYISTEDDDTFIISLNSGIDAEQLTDMLNIGLVEDSDKKNDVKESDVESNGSDGEGTIFVEINVPSYGEDDKTEKKNNKKEKTKVSKIYFCRTCNKIFKKKDNYNSHIATHDASLRRHACAACGRRFSYKSSLNKHRARRHAARAPRPAPPHACALCDRRFQQPWMLREHVDRDHRRLAPHVCPRCEKAFYKKCDLHVHLRVHAKSRPYACEVCARAFTHVSHYRRHLRSVDCTQRAKKIKSEEPLNETK